MIRITSTLIIHRPERKLYYLPEITEEVKKCIADGVCPLKLKEYLYAFGTYDEAGVFYLPADRQRETGMKYLVGIECRKDYHALDAVDLPFIELPACDLLIQDIAYEYQLNDELLDEIIRNARNVKNERSNLYHYIKGGLVAAFSVKEKLRIMYEIELVDQQHFLSDKNCEDCSKEELFHRAYHEPITEYYNWTWMSACLSNYYLEGVQDYGFVHFDIKDFKMINELYNHQVANGVLKRVTQNMEAHKDWIYYGARCDNDNFAMMIRSMPEEETKETKKLHRTSQNTQRNTNRERS